MTINDIESKRQESQIVLDSLKNGIERNILGQFATPNSLAVDIVRHLQSKFGFKGKVSFLEPAVGTGSFYSAVVQVLGEKAIKKAVGVEIDPPFAEKSAEIWSKHNLEIVNADFTKLEPNQQFDLLVTNPPYVRHHHIDGELKSALSSYARQRFGLKVSALSGLYCHFIYKAHEWLAPDAISVWLIPSEFMDVNYGQALKAYLTQFVTLEQIHRYNPQDVQFSDALVSSAIVIFRNRMPKAGHQVSMTFGGTIGVPAKAESVSVEELQRAHKWTPYPHSEIRMVVASGQLTIGDVFKVKRGLATGHNKFFIIEREKAAELEIPNEFLKPILPSTKFIPDNVVEADSEGFPVLNPQLVMIDCSLPESEIEAKYPKFFEYLQTGKEMGIDRGYLVKTRRTWYTQENRPGAPLICTYLGRPKPGTAPFRFILNKSRATATNVYLMLYPLPQMERRLKEEPELGEKLVAALNATSANAFYAEGRVYGGGLHKMEPRELMRLPIDPEIFSIPVDQGVLL